MVLFVNAQFNPKNKELELTRKTTFEIKGNTQIGLGWHNLESENVSGIATRTGGVEFGICCGILEQVAQFSRSQIAWFFQVKHARVCAHCTDLGIKSPWTCCSSQKPSSWWYGMDYHRETNFQRRGQRNWVRRRLGVSMPVMTRAFNLQGDLEALHSRTRNGMAKRPQLRMKKE